MASEIHVTLFVPLEEEAHYICNALKDQEAKMISPTSFLHGADCYVFEKKFGRSATAQINCHVIRDMGNLRAATRIGSTLFGPHGSRDNLVILIGLAGSLDKKNVGIGDVVISNEVKSYAPDKVKKIDRKKESFYQVPDGSESWAFKQDVESGKISVDERDKILKDSYFRYRRRVVRWDQSTRSIGRFLREVRSDPVQLSCVDGSLLPDGFEHLANDEPKICTGALLGSDFVIDCDEYVRLIHEKNSDLSLDIYTQKKGGTDHDRHDWSTSDLLAVDMESLGFFTLLRDAPGQTRTAMSIRGISDVASEKEHLDVETEKTLRDLAVKNAIRVAIDFVEFFASEVNTLSAR